MNKDIYTPRVLDDDKALEHFLFELHGSSTRATYKGVDFEAFYVGAPNLAAALFFSFWYGLVARWGRNRRGTHVKVHWPVPIDADLYLESRAKAEAAPQEDRLASRFVWSTSSDRRVREYFSGPLLDTLFELAEHTVVTITDAFVSFGPLPYEPSERAHLLCSLIDALPQPEGEQVLPPEEVPYGGEAEDLGKMVVIATSAHRRQVDMWRGKLKAFGVASTTYGYDLSQPWGSATPMRPIELKVYEADLPRAMELLQSTTEDTSFCHHCGEPVAVTTETCPKCDEVLIEEPPRA
ncbi:MAG: hypothetical protein JRH20_19665 [Deltaproteobacteria bacterium]|nr:hypothetical protein [Deltaproteobacteria bacterium]